MKHWFSNSLFKVLLVVMTFGTVARDLQGAYKRTLTRKNAVKIKAVNYSRQSSRQNSRKAYIKKAATHGRVLRRQQPKRPARSKIVARGKKPVRGLSVRSKAPHATGPIPVDIPPALPAAISDASSEATRELPATQADVPAPSTVALQTITATATATTAEWDQLLQAIKNGDLATVQTLVPSKIPATDKAPIQRRLSSSYHPSLLAVAQHYYRYPIIAYLIEIAGEDDGWDPQKIKQSIRRSYDRFLRALAQFITGQIDRSTLTVPLSSQSLLQHPYSGVALPLLTLTFCPEETIKVVRKALAYSKAKSDLKQLPAELSGRYQYGSPEYWNALNDFRSGDAYKTAEQKLRSEWLKSPEAQQLLVLYYTIYYQNLKKDKALQGRYPSVLPMLRTPEELANY